MLPSMSGLLEKARTIHSPPVWGRPRRFAQPGWGPGGRTRYVRPFIDHHMSSSIEQMLLVSGKGDADYACFPSRASYPQGDGHACGELNHLPQKSRVIYRVFTSRPLVRINSHLEPHVCRMHIAPHDFWFPCNLRLMVLQQQLLLPTYISDRHCKDNFSPLLK